MEKFLKKLSLLLCGVILVSSLAGCQTTTETQSDPPVNTTVIASNIGPTDNNDSETTPSFEANVFDIGSVPEYTGVPYVEVNNNISYFTADELNKARDCIDNGTTYFDDDNEHYSELDSLGRCGVATALLSRSTMPPENEKRGAIGMVKPAGWHTITYPDVISDRYLYNRCHLIGWQLGNENANEKNLTTGTRYLNVDGMLPFENQVADYIKTTDHHVLYRVTPIFVDDELVCRGILMEAQSLEDNGCVFCVYCYDVQPSIQIDYLTGDSLQVNVIDDPVIVPTDSDDGTEKKSYVLNTNSMKVHTPDCSAVGSMSDANREDYKGTLEEIIDMGYAICKMCNPT